jgi:hypothetical protein
MLKNKASQEEDKELLHQRKLSEKLKKELRTKKLDHPKSNLMPKLQLKKRKIRSKPRKKPSKIKNQRIMMMRKWQNTMSLLQTLSNSMETLLPNNLDKLQ